MIVREAAIIRFLDYMWPLVLVPTCAIRSRQSFAIGSPFRIISLGDQVLIVRETIQSWWRVAVRRVSGWVSLLFGARSPESFSDQRD